MLQNYVKEPDCFEAILQATPMERNSTSNNMRSVKFWQTGDSCILFVVQAQSRGFNLSAYDADSDPEDPARRRDVEEVPDKRALVRAGNEIIEGRDDARGAFIRCGET